MSDRHALRRQLRARRRALSRAQQRLASERLLRRLRAHPWFRNARRMACYWPADGEINPLPLLAEAHRLGKRCYLPVLHHGEARLRFARYWPGEPLFRNRFGIPEPDPRRWREAKPWTLDLVLLPLVGFDADGGRLGMGGGFYDRTFAYKRQRPAAKPRLLGVAHRCQQVEGGLPLASWDVPLAAVATDERLWVAASN